MFSKRLIALAMACACGLATPGASAQSVSIPSAAQNFDSLASTGTTNPNTTLPSGWYMAESGSNANTTYVADDGASNSGNTVSYGSIGSGERALGGLQSSSLNPTIGAKLVNQSGGTLAQIVVQYTGEQWRLGTVARVDRLDFQYSLDATSLTTGTWTNVDALDFVAPVTAGTAGALNGNSAANRSSVSGNISDLSLADGATIWVRWTDLNATSNDDGLAIDDISFTAGGPPVNTPPSVTSTVPANSGSVLPGTQSFTVNFSESVTAQDTAFTMQCSVTGSVALTLPGAPKQSRPQGSARSGSVRLATLNGANIQVAATGTSIALSTTANLQNGETCTLTIDADGIVDSENAHPTADTVVNFSVTLPPNVLPTVASTVPANNGSVLPGTQSFTVNFSESVTAQDNAFTMQCSVAGSVPLALPAPKVPSLATDRGRIVPAYLATHAGANGKAFATGSSVTLTTSANLQNGETCVFTIDADGIVDSQNAHPAADTIVNFSVAPPPNVLPTVVSSTPAHNATGVAPAADFRIEFSEMVSADTEAFALQCSQSGLIAPLSSSKVLEITPTGGRVMTLSAMTVLQAGETCNLTVFAIGVLDDDGDAMAQDRVIHFTVAGSSLTYYNQVNTSSAEQLRCSLHETINGHTAYPYSSSSTDTWDILEIADEDPNNSGRILDVYKNRSFTKVSDRAGTGSGLTYNREHTWPNSLGFPDSGSTPYTDTHMLYLSDTNYNSDRGNSPYDDCSGCTERTTEVNNGFGGGSGTYPGNSNWFNASKFQTWGHRKGDVARAVMYMAIRYEGDVSGEPDLELTDNLNLVVGTTSSPAYMGKLATLLAWHAADPPDAAELARNQVIFSFQGNRNPFIDHPEWATNALFTSSKPTSCQLAN